MHATPEEILLIQTLSSQLDPETSDIDELLRLVQLYICPRHDDETAMAILDVLHRREPENPWVVFWIAYILLFSEIRPEAVQRARDMLEHNLALGSEGKGGLYQLLYEVRKEPADASQEELLGLLDESIRLEPGWVSNRLYLGVEYMHAGRKAEAIEQLEIARSNLGDWLSRTDVANSTIFEEEIVGCSTTYVPQRIEELLAKLRAEE